MKTNNYIKRGPNFDIVWLGDRKGTVTHSGLVIISQQPSPKILLCVGVVGV